MGRVYIPIPKTGARIEVHYRVHDMKCQKCKAINKGGRCVEGKLSLCDKHNKCKSR